MSRLVVAPGGLITSAWGNQTHDQTMISFTSATQRTTDWPAPADGARSWLADSHTSWQYRGGAWRGLPMGYLADGLGPSSQVDVAGATTLLTVNAPVVAGRRYRVSGLANGSQITATGPIVQTWLEADQGAAGGVASGKAYCTYDANLPVGGVAIGDGYFTFAATATATIGFRLRGQATAGALRVAANNCTLLVEDIGS